MYCGVDWRMDRGAGPFIVSGVYTELERFFGLGGDWWGWGFWDAVKPKPILGGDMDRKTFEKIRWNNETGIAENPNNQHLVDEFLLSKKEAGNGNLSPMKAFFENRLGEKWQYLTGFS